MTMRSDERIRRNHAGDSIWKPQNDPNVPEVVARRLDRGIVRTVHVGEVQVDGVKWDQLVVDDPRPKLMADFTFDYCGTEQPRSDLGRYTLVYVKGAKSWARKAEAWFVRKMADWRSFRRRGPGGR